MNICFVTNRMNSGGIARTISSLANVLCGKHNVSLILTYSLNTNSFYTIDSRISVFSFFTEKQQWLTRRKRIRKILNDIKPDIILTFHFNDTFFVSFSNFKYGYHIACERNNPYSVPYTPLKRFIRNIGFRKADAYCFQTSDQKEYFSFKNKPTTIIPNPVNLLFDNKNVFKTDKTKTIFTVGRLEAQKNHFLLLDAFSMFEKKHPDYLLKIYGVGSLKSKLENHITELGLKEKVLLLGESKTWQKTEANSSMFVLSSDYEGFPNALEEAMALQIPCISTDCPIGGPRELIKNNINGILVKVGKPVDMANAMDKLANNPGLANTFSMNNSDLKNEYSLDAIAERWRLFFEEVINFYEKK